MYKSLGYKANTVVYTVFFYANRHYAGIHFEHFAHNLTAETAKTKKAGMANIMTGKK